MAEDKPPVFEDFGERRYDFRGKVNEEIDERTVHAIGQGYAETLDNGSDVVIGHDQRPISTTFYEAMKQGLQDGGSNPVSVRTRGETALATTDLVSYLTKSKGCDAGMIATPSHLDAGYGGVKLLQKKGRILNTTEMYEAMDRAIHHYNNPSSSQRKGGISTIDDALKTYQNAVKNHLRNMFQSDLSGMNIAFDAGNAVGGLTLPDLLRSYGATTTVLHEDMAVFPNGRHPEPNQESLEDLCRYVSQNDAVDIGLATDGDADRIRVVNEHGDLLPGDDVLALLGEHYVSEANEPRVVFSENTAEYASEHIRSNDGLVSYEQVGAVFTALRCLNDNIRFGGQPNGHYMDTAFTPYDSGTLFGLATALQAKETSVSSLQERLPDHAMYRDTYHVAQDELEPLFRKAKRSLETSRLTMQETQGTSVRFSYNGATVFMRPSGTEPVMRIQSEAESLQTAKEAATYTRHLLGEKPVSHDHNTIV